MSTARRSNRQAPVFMAIVLILFSWVGQTHAAFLTYNSETAFLSGIGLNGLGNLQTLDFESQAQGDLIPSGTSVDGVTFTYSIPGYTMMVDNFFNTTSDFNYLGLDSMDGAFVHGDSFSMDFGSTVNAVGLYVIAEASTVLSGDFELSTTAGSAFNSGTPDVVLPDGEAFFIGLIETNSALGFTSADLSSVDEWNYVFNVDDITTAAVPIPSTFYLLGSAVLALALRRQRGLYRKG